MRYRFLSAEYLEEAARRTRESEAYQKAAHGFDDTLCFIVEPEPDKGVTERRVVGMRLPQADEHWVGEERPATFNFTAPYGVYVDIMTGKLDAVRAITQRRLRLVGPMPKLLRYVKGTQAWIDVLRSIPTEFEGQYRDRSFGE